MYSDKILMMEEKMNFVVEKEIFERLPNVFFGVVMAKGINNKGNYPQIDKLLNDNIEIAAKYFEGKKVKEEKDILPYREAFKMLNINPNKYLCSIEALFTRIAKGKGMPHINPVVDLVNALSLKYTLPMGAHDLSDESEDICIRLANEKDTFIPFGSETVESVEPNEVVYAVGKTIRTRRWTWRQSERGKITSESKNIFFPIDGFTDINKNNVLAAVNELNDLVKQIWKCETIVGIVDRAHPQLKL